LAIDVEALFRRFGPMVHRRCMRILRNDADADDAMQDVFVRVVRRGESLSDERVGALLWTMATQVSLNRLRTKKRKPEDGSELMDVIASAEDIEERTIVGRTLDALFAREERGQRIATRTLAVLRYVDRMTLDEVASATGLSAGAIRKRLDGLKQRVAALEAP
jgi:RNA polymerase sigma-70 factor, ECF subfamily